MRRKIFDGMSLLQKEIKTAEPKAVVFVIGPTWRYYHSLSLAFFGNEKSDKKVDEYLNACGEKYPDIKSNRYCVKINENLGLKMPAYYTYHPHYLARKHIMDNVIQQIFSDLEI